MSDFRAAQLMNVEYEYKNDDKTISIKIPYFQLTKGDRVCLYGESGQGKSTLLNILSGEIETNEVIVNGQTEQNRLECVFIAQDTEILDMSLRDNLTLGRKNIEDQHITYPYPVDLPRGDKLVFNPADSHPKKEQEKGRSPHCRAAGSQREGAACRRSQDPLRAEYEPRGPHPAQRHRRIQPTPLAPRRHIRPR